MSLRSLIVPLILASLAFWLFLFLLHFAQDYPQTEDPATEEYQKLNTSAVQSL